jgi:hypothetical protein
VALQEAARNPRFMLYPCVLDVGGTLPLQYLYREFRFQEICHFEERRGARNQSEARACDLGDPFGTN